jgi:hypothetical protein
LRIIRLLQGIQGEVQGKQPQKEGKKDLPKKMRKKREIHLNAHKICFQGLIAGKVSRLVSQESLSG